jgi:cbb3-type cytochrome oxidase maturation protein
MGLYLFAIALCMGAAAWCVLVWAVKDGQFKDSEELRNSPLDSEEKYS